MSYLILDRNLTTSATTSAYNVHEIEQLNTLNLEKAKCNETIKNFTPPTTGLYCEPIWDEVMCWGSTLAGTVAKRRCPDYIKGLWTKGHAKRLCTENGTWYIPPSTNTSWTDFGECLYKKGINFTAMQDHLPRIRLMYNIGYGISLCSLVVAVFIMLFCRKMSSKSNTLHINLFIAFILRAFMSFLKESLFIEGLGLQKDIININGFVKFREQGLHWECKLLYTVFVYTLSACNMWIFMEALYLYMLVYKTMFTEKHGVQMYIVFGWLGPLTFIIPWIIVRAELEDLYCWHINPSPEYLWIIRGPLLGTTIINFVFFIVILRVLFIRVRKNIRVSGARKARKLAKFIVVLIPLFGVCYIVFNFLSGNDIDVERDIPYLYCEMFYNSFQGFILAVLFCFLNEELQRRLFCKKKKTLQRSSFQTHHIILRQVHQELKKAWYRFALRRKESYVYTRSAMKSSWRKGSRNSRTFSSIMERSSDNYNGHSINKGKNNNGVMSRSNTDSMLCERSRIYDPDVDNMLGGTCAETNCRFLTVPDEKRRILSRYKYKDNDL